MNSYTISDLEPSTTYTVLLCLHRNSHKITVSSLEVTTRPQSYMVQLGIVTDYTAIVLGNTSPPTSTSENNEKTKLKIPTEFMRILWR